MARKIGKITLKVVGYIMILIAAVLIGSFIGDKIYHARYLKNLPDFAFVREDGEVQYCPIHTQARVNGPVIVNTAEGSASEVRLFSYSPTNPYKIKEEEHYGYMTMAGGKGWSGFCFPDNRYADINISRKSLYNYSHDAASYYFCSDCLTAIEEINPSTNFIIVDCYDNEDIKYYDLKEVEEGLTIRHYTFEVEDMDEYNYQIKMTSSYYEGGKELDY